MNYYNEIKQQLINNEVYKKVKDYSKNKSDLNTYYNVGKLIVEAQGGEKRAKYGDNLIKEYSMKLTKEIGKGYTFTSLSRMRQFYLMFKNIATMSQQLTWSHYLELLKFDNLNNINYYIYICENQNLSVRELKNKISLSNILPYYNNSICCFDWLPYYSINIYHVFNTIHSSFHQNFYWMFTHNFSFFLK